MVIFYKKWKKYNKIQLTKNKMDLNIQKMTNHPPSPHNNIRDEQICKPEFDEELKMFSNVCSQSNLQYNI